MKFERFKSILLVLLVISSIVLTVNKWFNEKLWPDGYNFFSDVKNYFVPDKINIYSFDPVEAVLRPSKIIINNSGNHTLYTKSSTEYNSIFSELKEILELAALEKPVISDSSEWDNCLKGKSCYFSYPVEYGGNYFFTHLSKEHQNSVKSLQEFVVTIDNRVTSSVYLYLRDTANDNVVKYRLSHKSDVLNQIIEQTAYSSDGINYYSFELNFDAVSDDQKKEHIVIDSDVLINISPKSIASIGEQNLFNNIAEHPELYSPILSEFGYNTSAIRRYVETDNSAVFVENYGTLKFHTNGFIDYKSVNSSNGVALSGETIYECINAGISFVNRVSMMLGFSGDMYWEISSDIADITSKSFKLCFDYYINDNMIIIPENDYSMKHAVEMEVSGGKIISYKQLCRNYYTGDYHITCSSAIDAIDSLDSDDEGVFADVISDIFTAYTFNTETKIWQPMWYIENSEGDISVISVDYGGAGV